MLLREYLEHGWTKETLAGKLGINRRTIYRWVETGQLDRNLDNTAVSYANRPPVPRVCYTQVKEYVRKIRPRPPDEWLFDAKRHRDTRHRWTSQSSDSPGGNGGFC